MTTTLEPSAPATTTATLATRVADWARREPERCALRSKHLGIWREITWRQYWETVLDVAHALLALGVEPGDRVAIHSENRPEWLFVDVATVAIRGTTTGIYPTNPAAEVRYLLDNAGAGILVAEDQEQVDKALEVADSLPGLRRIVYLDPRGVRGYDDPRLLAWEDLLELGREHRRAHEGAVEARMAATEPSDITTLIYTSGTTGPPKGAMLTIANVEFAIQVILHDDGVPPPTPDDQLVSYLPLAHVAERLFTTWLNAASGAQVNFAESIETVQQALREVQPTIVFGVPRIWEKMMAGVSIRMAKASRLKRANYRVWMKAADWIGRTLIRTGGQHTPATRIVYAIGWVFLFRALRDRIGLRKTRWAGSGAAPIAPEVLAFFMGIGVPMHEVYGMTENSAIATANWPGRIKLGTVGEPQPGVEIRIDERTGEILTRHPGTFVGYWRNEEATRAVLEPDGWLHTGDVGEWVDGTHLRITDRIKDIIITAGGKNIAPSELENSLKASPYIKEAIVVGDRRKFLSALIVIELDTVGDWAQQRGLSYTTFADLTSKPEVRELVQREVDRVNDKFASVEQIKKFALLPKELDEDQGELTATQKVKRSAITATFSDLVESMYDGSRS